jgi:Fe-S-cluster containining protein
VKDIAGACTACGDCCDPVWYPLGAADIRQSASTTGAADLVFAAAHWHATGQRSEDLHGYQCDRFDRETRLCTAHDERPPICRAYPILLNILPTRCTVRLPSA